MSSLIIDTLPITDILVHPQADKLEIAVFKGWNCIVIKGQFSPGDLATFFPPDTLLPKELGEELNVTKYLKGLGRNYPDRERFSGRVGVARLRGVPSCGILVRPRPDWLIHSDNLIEYLGLSKYEPPEEILDGDAERRNSFFHHYTDMENLRNFPSAFADGDVVVVHEKIHGRNCRIGLCEEEGEMILMAGSHKVRRRQFDTQGRRGFYWKPLEMYPQIETLLRALHKEYGGNIVLFGEVYGPGCQDLTYGQQQINFLTFDIAVNTQYLDALSLYKWTSEFNVPYVPCMYTGPFIWETIEDLSTSPSRISSVKQIREGIVIRPPEESWDSNGRKIYKLINFEYLNRKEGTEHH